MKNLLVLGVTYLLLVACVGDLVNKFAGGSMPALP